MSEMIKVASWQLQLGDVIHGQRVVGLGENDVDILVLFDDGTQTCYSRVETLTVIRGTE